LGHAVDGLLDEIGQQIRADRVDDAEAQRAGNGVLATLGRLFDAGGAFDHRLSLAHDLLAEWRDGDFVRATLEQLDLQFIFELLDGHAQRGLGNEAGFGGSAEVPFAGHGNDVAQFGERHGLENSANLMVQAFK